MDRFAALDITKLLTWEEISPVLYLDSDGGRGRLGHSVGQPRALGWSPDIGNIRHAGEQ